ncbi:MAG: hypothetical protein CO023_02700 [Flavobacteriales bacterium CG_4_9_14_0_2_um_filter_35_242]|nr:MAG: hypothetical protein COS42_07615 [Flavobacteriales bacterium CG03_land_8_20_14_0_80_35_15]PIX05767.1 MAG: hypothetical protein COZ76_12475 [Flavobacteriales bacterium CG_4_8_14_3_um_filter_35_10]PJC59704.1 MAG: hypothetical protein CO023_02700 [Flavobacteriales bacterium CG_4_9_14_0_2_um_filter_35_242]
MSCLAFIRLQKYGFLFSVKFFVFGPLPISSSYTNFQFLTLLSLRLVTLTPNKSPFMNQIKIAFCLLFVLVIKPSFAQKSESFTTPLKNYQHAVERFENADYATAQFLFNNLGKSLDKTSELTAQIEFYKAFCTIKLNQADGDNQMLSFVMQYPTSLKATSAFLEVANYYFETANYLDAIKWYDKVNADNLRAFEREQLNFNKAYTLFSLKKYTLAKPLFAALLNSNLYGDKATYYYGYIAYAENDYDNANKYLSQVANQSSYAKNTSYSLADINFKTGHFEKAINLALPLLKKANRTENSPLAKIIGESYFNLKKYEQAIPYLLQYKGEKGHWNNTDYYQLGYAYYRQKNYENAINWFNKIVNGVDAVAQNASYHLADCYLQISDKSAALNAFKNASEMDFDLQIKEQSFYNYAKLGYEIGNPYNNVAQVFIEFLKTYPKNQARKEINQLLMSAFMRSKDYEGALKYYEHATDFEQIQTYQKAAYYYGIQLFLESNFDAAINLFNKALAVKLTSDFNALAQFWRGESHYQKANYNKALDDFKKLESSRANLDGLNYNLGYTYFKQKDYQNALRYFKAFVAENNSDTERTSDSYLRLGDSYFALSRYAESVEAFSNALLKNTSKSDYARYQTAMSYGFINNNANKINTLKTLVAKNKSSRWFDDALFELGNTYLKTDQNELALQTYDQLINNETRSPFRVKALLKEGLIYNNQGNSAKALEIYKRVASDFNKAPEAQQAVKNAKEIYSDLGQIDQYETWIKGLSFVTETDETLDKAMYNSAEKLYLQNNFENASKAFDKYLQRFPQGLNVLEANFYSAQSFLNLDKKDSAISAFENVLNLPNNLFTEQALLKLALIYLEKSDWNGATPVLIRLEDEAQDPQNKRFAQSNLMKAYFAKDHFALAISYAEKVLKYNDLDANMASDALVITARSAVKTEDFNKAKQAYKALEKTASGKLMAEALYYDAFFKNQDGFYKESNKVIQKLASNYATYRYFGAKGLVVMAQNFYGLKDAYQATYILESVLKNFTDYPDITDQAQTLLSEIKKKEAETNTSVKQ